MKASISSSCIRCVLGIHYWGGWHVYVNYSYMDLYDLYMDIVSELLVFCASILAYEFMYHDS